MRMRKIEALALIGGFSFVILCALIYGMITAAQL